LKFNKKQSLGRTATNWPGVKRAQLYAELTGYGFIRAAFWTVDAVIDQWHQWDQVWLKSDYANS